MTKDKRHKILFVHDYPPTEGGGVEVNVFKSAKELTKLGYEVVIGTSRFASETYKYTAESKVVDEVRIELLDSTKKLQELVEWSDIVHIYFTFSCRPASMEALKYCVQNGKKCIFSIRTSHKHIPFSSLGTMLPLERDTKLDFIKNSLANDSVIISAPSNCINESIEWFGLDKELHVIHNGTDFSVDSSQNVDVPGSVDITYVGEISFLKGMSYLIDALRHLSIAFPEIKVRLIGSGSDIKEIKQLAEYYELENNIEFVGYVPNSKVSSYLKVSSLYVQPSLTEVWSNSVLEALSLGVPVICSEIEGLIELTNNGDFAELVSVGSSVKLASAFSNFFSNAAYRTELLHKAKIASEYIENEYTLKDQVENMHDLYKKVLNM